MKAYFLASLAAILVQPLWLLAWIALPSLIAGDSVPLMEMAIFSMFAALVAAPFVLVVGIPSALLLRRSQHQGLYLAAIGFAAAAVPLADDVRWHALANLECWEDFLPMLVFGMHGLIGALTFHAVQRRVDDENPRHQNAASKATSPSTPTW